MFYENKSKTSKHFDWSKRGDYVLKEYIVGTSDEQFLHCVILVTIKIRWCERHF